jgi:hypothetical protein
MLRPHRLAIRSKAARSGPHRVAAFCAASTNAQRPCGEPGARIYAFVLQQISLSAGFLATSVATVSVTNPIIPVAIGVLLFDERLSRPAWHVVVAVRGLALAMLGAVAISIARERAGRAPVPASA